MTEQKVLVIGSDQAGLRAARDLADAGLETSLVESGPFLGGGQGDLGPNFLENAHQLEILNDPGIKVRTNTEVLEICPDNKGFLVRMSQSPRFVDLESCTACGECVEVCPVTIPESGLKAIHFGGQPGCVVIEKSGIPPCTNACPAGIHVQGYVALIKQGRYQEAYRLIYDALPFPSVCGRVCNHYCEQACNRSQIDQPVNLMGLKRFVADWAFDHPEEIDLGLDPASGSRPGEAPSNGKKVAVVGAGPAGLTAARDLVRKGHQAVVMDENPAAGGMMRVGIPPHRLPYDHLELEIEQILREGVELRLNTRVDDIPGLLERGYDAVLIATGAHQAVKIPIEGADHPDNWLSLEFLKKACLGEPIDLQGRKVIVLGGGDVAMDAARVAVRLGTAEVKLVCRGMRASFTEIREAEEEGIELIRGRVFQKVVVSGKKIAGVECLEAEVGDIVDGRRQFRELPNTAHLIEGDLVIWALGQRPDYSFLPEGNQIALAENRGIQADEQLMTSLPGVFTAGDVHHGTTFFVVDAVGDGHRAAAAIDSYLDGNGPGIQDLGLQERILSRVELGSRVNSRKSAQVGRQEVPCLAVEDRLGNFREVDLAFEAEAAAAESGRCLVCGPCSECMACVEVCEPGAIHHQEGFSQISLRVEEVLAPRGFDIDQDLPGVIHYTAGEEISGSAAAFQVLKTNQLDTLQNGHVNLQKSRNGSKVGMVVCQCAGQISKHINTAEVCRQALAWPEVDFAAEIRVSCSPEGGDELKRIIRENDLGKMILAACSCCSMDQVCYSCTYQRTRCKQNLGVFSPLESLAQIEFVNIREQCAWVHRNSKRKATAAALDLVRSALGRIPIKRLDLSQQERKAHQVMILGGGDSARVCQESLEVLGLDALQVDVLSEKIIRSGGKYRLAPEIPADGLVLAPGSRAELEHILGSILLANQRPILAGEIESDGSPAHGLVICPLDVDSALAGQGAAARIYAWLERTFNQVSPHSAAVDPTRCRSCGTCLEVCGFGIPELIEGENGTYADINPYLCQDCGLCTAHCPSGAIQPGTDQTEELERVLEWALS